MKSLYLIILFLLAGTYAYCGGDTTRLTLQEVVELAKGNSIAAKQAVTTRDTR
jgi:outer membrane protein